MYPVPRCLTETTPESGNHVPQMYITPGNSDTITSHQSLTASFLNYQPTVPINNEIQKLYVTTASNCQSPVFLVTPLDKSQGKLCSIDSNSSKDSLMQNSLSGFKRLPEESDGNQFIGCSASKRTKLNFENVVSNFCSFYFQKLTLYGSVILLECLP